MDEKLARHNPEKKSSGRQSLTRRGRGWASIARRSSRLSSRSAESGMIDAPGVVREDEKAGRRIFARTEPVDASDEKHSPVQESERLVEAPQSAGRRSHAQAPELAGGGTASRRRFGRTGSR